MEKKGPVADSDSDSSSDLPSLDSIFQRCIFDITKLKKDDIVWAEYKDLHWPALVRNVDKKKKKVTVWYADSPGKPFKLPFKKILCYNDIDTSVKVQFKAMKSPLADKHSRVCSRTMLFIENKSHGVEIDPIKFFDLSKPYFMVAEYYPGSSKYSSESTSSPGSSEVQNTSENTSSPGSSEVQNISENTSTPASSELKFGCENISTPGTSEFNSENVSTEKMDDKNVNLEESSDGESSVKSDVQNHTSVNRFPVFSESPSPYDDEMIEKISSCITAGHVDNYLIDIYNFKIKNKIHESYMKALKTDTTEGFWCNPTKGIPISSEKLRPITVYLDNLFIKKFGEEGMNGVKRHEYVVLVWLPEAVEKAVSIEAESSKLPVDSGSNVTISSSFGETSELLVDSGRSNIPTWSFQIEASESPANSSSSNIPTSSFQIEASESPANSYGNNSFSAPKRKFNFVSTLVKNNHDSNVLDTETCTSSKIKFIGRKKQKVQSKALRSVKGTAAKKMV